MLFKLNDLSPLMYVCNCLLLTAPASTLHPYPFSFDVKYFNWLTIAGYLYVISLWAPPLSLRFMNQYYNQHFYKALLVSVSVSVRKERNNIFFLIRLYCYAAEQFRTWIEDSRTRQTHVAYTGVDSEQLWDAVRSTDRSLSRIFVSSCTYVCI